MSKSVALASSLLILALLCAGCVTRDHRRFFSPIRKTIDRGDSDEVIRDKLLALTPMGTTRDRVLGFLEDNLRGSAELRLDLSPSPQWHTAGQSLVRGNLWIRYVFIYAEFETIAYYVFDEHGKLVKLTVSTVDSCW